MFFRSRENISNRLYRKNFFGDPFPDYTPYLGDIAIKANLSERNAISSKNARYILEHANEKVSGAEEEGERWIRIYSRMLAAEWIIPVARYIIVMYYRAIYHNFSDNQRNRNNNPLTHRVGKYTITM